MIKLCYSKNLKNETGYGGICLYSSFTESESSKSQLEISLIYLVSFGTTSAMWRNPVSKQKQMKKHTKTKKLIMIWINKNKPNQNPVADKNIMMIKIEISETTATTTTKKIQTFNQSESWFFGKIYRIDRSLAQLTEIKIEPYRTWTWGHLNRH